MDIYVLLSAITARCHWMRGPRHTGDQSNEGRRLCLAATEGERRGVFIDRLVEEQEQRPRAPAPDHVHLRIDYVTD
jgi:hypothetical protein